VDNRPELTPREALELEVEKMRQDDLRRLAEREEEGNVERDQERLEACYEEQMAMWREAEERRQMEEMER
jgi:hypothetical protein